MNIWSFGLSKNIVDWGFYHHTRWLDNLWSQSQGFASIGQYMQYTSYWEIKLDARVLCFPRRYFRASHMLASSMGSVIRSINASLFFLAERWRQNLETVVMAFFLVG